ncbi:prolyl oligopeptidase family serine peptidase [Salipaludibacillus sp. LMS25]|jgi:dipeptidyl aminopeptidase/acylaminoacyl peptidase|uniref:alpha/beta hydrolase family protein n=1 Tax=Salipaludibacillus sp. LMS25 TaxID=2924031 RepID=UPI0020D02392|nr:prolyl oligopeptidase family serine peptidase [Salipaludibacillus sp. LMS25]UTR15515.1 prolyl oligopeptidase family serine peptidase [Salipaludibacillus sp. LMS25]
MKKYLLHFTCILGLLVLVFIAYRYLQTGDVVAWAEEAQHVQIPSSADNTTQDAYFISSTQVNPLVVSLHQWSYTFEHLDPISDYALEHDWNYIRPNFRGTNNHPQACGSPLVISDIDDAIQYAIEHGNVDAEQIHIIGASGGGYASLQHLMTSDFTPASYSAWVPITDLAAWYGESKIRENKYFEDILQCTDSVDSLNLEEAKKRSPLHQDTPIDKIKDTRINIFAGINDGYDGSVPISHSIDFYNKIVNDMGFDEEYQVSGEKAHEMLYTQQSTEPTNKTIGDRDILYEKQTYNISLKIFDGDHEILKEEAFNLLLNMQ